MQLDDISHLLAEVRRQLAALHQQSRPVAEARTLLAQELSRLDTALEGIAVINARSHVQETALRDQEELYRQLAENVQEVFWISDAETGATLYVSPAYERVWKRPVQHFYDDPRSFLEAVHPEDRARVEEAQPLLRSGDYDEEYRIVWPDGETRWVRSRTFPVRDSTGAIYRIAGTTHDITDRKRNEEHLVHEALHDGLTELPNRTLFLDRLLLAMERAKRLNGPRFAVLFIDLDRFKLVNDSLGHIAGDRLLIEMARRLELCLRPGDTVARFGGDEFAILLEDIEDAEDATRVAERVQQALAAPIQIRGQELFSSGSIGIVLGAPHYHRATELLRDADTAMYHAKAHGRARHEVFNPTMHARAMAQMRLEAHLRRALERQEFLLHYQPIIGLKSGMIIGVEALIRWQHPQRGLIDPSEFIPVAEETGLLIPIGRWALHTACAQAKAWNEIGPVPLYMSVNLSARQLKHHDVSNMVAQILAVTGLEPRYLHLEITESSIMENAETTLTTLRKLKDLGINLSIDDFGTGYSSLSYLKRFPVSTVKIDQSFVRDITTDPADAAISTAIIAMAHSLNLSVTPEGVETEDQLDFLRSYNCDAIQGYLFSRPLPADALARFVQERNGPPPTP